MNADIPLARLEELGPALLRYFAAVFPRDEAADLVQETLLRLLEKVRAGAWDPERGSLRMYAYGFARLVKREARTRRPLGADAGAEIPDVAHPGPGAQEQLEGFERQMRLRRAILALPEPQSEILLLHLDAEFGLEDIAAQLSLNLNTVKSHIHRAKDRLREELLRSRKEASL